MYTLMNQSKTLCTGIFPSAAEAQDWADSFLPELKLQSIELLTDENTLDTVKSGEGWTWTKNRPEQRCSMLNLPVC